MLFAGALMVFVSMTSSITERTKEIGVLRAIGFRKIHIIKVIQTEALVISLLAGILGSLSGAVVSILVGGLGGFNSIILGVSIFISILIGLSSSLYPAFKASRLEPIEAMRYI
jgi:putative ABC transport system permease protein